jgi:hypothetical protein
MREEQDDFANKKYLMLMDPALQTSIVSVQFEQTNKQQKSQQKSYYHRQKQQANHDFKSNHNCLLLFGTRIQLCHSNRPDNNL